RSELVESRNDASSQFIICKLADQDYGVRITEIREIIRMQAVTALPDAPAYVSGILDFRGEVIAVVDLRRRLGLPSAPHTEESRIVILDLDDHKVGITVDAVTEVTTVPHDSISAEDSAVIGARSEDVQSIAKLDDRLVILLRVESLAGVGASDDSGESQQAVAA
ncbi:MAG: chemotaxis protein CheW, partial [Dehalococcoidia bacterium]